LKPTVFDVTMSAMDEEPIEVVDGEAVAEADALPALAEVREITVVPAPSAGLGAVQAVAAAATGFVAGAATLALARRYGARRVERLSRGLVSGGRRPSDFWPSPGTTRTYVVRVHVLGRPE
jgi:glyoxylate carboligase